MPAPASTLRQSLTRGGPLVVALLMGAALVGSAAVNYRDTTVAAEAIAARQGQRIWIGMRRELGPPGVPPARDDLERAVAAHELLYLATWIDGARVAEAGTA